MTPARPCQVEVLTAAGAGLDRGQVELPTRPDPVLLGRIQRSFAQVERAARLVVRQERVVRALWLRHDHLPPATLPLAGGLRGAGRWFTSAVELGDGGLGRALVGPDAFLRQVDVGGSHAWMAPVFMRFGAEVPVRGHLDPEQRVWEFEVGGCRYLYRSRGIGFELYGAGSTPARRVAEALEAARPCCVRSLVWAMGGLRIA